MNGLRVLASRLLGLFRKPRLDGDLDAELGAHLQLLTDENIRRGLSPKEARQAARREFGGVVQTLDAYREQQSMPLIESLLQDFRYAIRMLCKTPGFTAIAVLTLALGIGANAAVFSLVDAVLLHSLPYRDSNRLLLVSETLPQQGSVQLGVSPAEYFDYREANQVFSQVAAFESAGFNLTGDAAPVRVHGAQLSASAFPLLGVTPILGRTFSENEDRAGAAGVILLSNALWKNHYGADERVLGKIIKLDEKPYTVIGVMPPSFKFPFDGAILSESADFWVPEAFPRDRFTERVNEFGVGFIGRLKPDVSKEQAQADVERIAANFMRRYPESYSGTIRVAPRVFELSMHSVAKVRPSIFLLQGSALCVLLIACANTASLLLAKAGHRRREMAVRSAIGASSSRLLRQCFVESCCLSLLGGLAGMFLAALLLAGARRFGPADLPQLQDLSLDATAFGFTFALSIATALLFGVAPAWRMSRVLPLPGMKETAHIGRMQGSQGMQNALSVAEIAIAVVLLTGGGLLLQSFRRLLEVPMGFQPRGAIIVRTVFDRARYGEPLKREAVQKEILAQLRALPGLREVAAASHLPLSDNRQIGFRPGFAAEDDYHWAENSLVSPGYFAAMGTPLLHGRDFGENDGQNGPQVAIVNQALAQKYFPGSDAIGKHFHWGDRGIFTIIGVAANVHISALDADPAPMIYNSMFQVESGASGRTAFILRLAGPGEPTEQGVFAAVRERVWALDKDLPLYGETTLSALVSASVGRRRFTMLLMIGFAAISLLLAVGGLVGVVSYLVAQRTRELAIRMALGADPPHVGWMILKQASALGLAGCGIGLSLFAVTSPLFAANLYQVHCFDPLTMTAVSTLLLAVVILAACVPARRATRVDPVVALRYE